MLRLNNIMVSYNDEAQMPTTVLKNVNLLIKDGEFVIIVGNNGCGKSTMLNTIAGHIHPDGGKLLIDDQDVTQQNIIERSALVALVMQEPGLGTIGNMTLEENLSLAYMRGKPRKLRLHNTKQRRELFKEYLSMLDMKLENRLDELAKNLSGGQRQALSLIMAIIAESRVLLLDEITAALDPKAADKVMELAAKLVQEQKRTAILITHNMQYALNYGDRTLLMTNDNQFREYDLLMRRNLTPSKLAAEISGY